ncbi:MULTISPECIES: DUF956 family protein [Anaerococcus]|uniref:DUF956 family protein n=1 Tax=Anaerococcus TaxID=165779 RepID=UPI000CF992B1|nr:MULTISPECIES: DUF956 family protein [Anaerococcus]
MVQSQNTKVDLTIPATNLNGLTSQGKVMVGDRAFEYYNDRNKADFIQIPWKEIRLVTAAVIFKKKITRFAIHTKSNGDFIFSTRDNKKTLRAINKYIADDKLRKSLTVLDYLKRK